MVCFHVLSTLPTTRREPLILLLIVALPPSNLAFFILISSIFRISAIDLLAFWDTSFLRLISHLL